MQAALCWIGRLNEKVLAGAAVAVIVTSALGCTRDLDGETTPAAIQIAAIGIGPGAAPISPASASIPVGTERVFKTTLGSTAVWSISKPTIASVSGAGVVTSLKAGTAMVTVTEGTRTASAALTVTTATLKAIDVAETKRVGFAGQGRVTFAATGVFDNGQRLPLAAVQWTTSDLAIATISSDGVLTPIVNGDVVITATDAVTGISGTATFTVTGLQVTAVTVSPAKMSLPLGFEGTFKATVLFGRLRNQHPDTVVWSVADPTIASISDAGIVTALSQGATTVWATERSSGMVGSAQLTVTSDRTVDVQVSCGSKKQVACALPADGSVTLTALATAITTARRAVPLAWAPIWTSSNDSIATVTSTQQPKCTPLQLRARNQTCSEDPAGLVVGVSPGKATITATDPGSGRSDSVVVTVSVLPKLARIVVSPLVAAAASASKKVAARAAVFTLPVGASQAYTATALYGDNKNKPTAQIDVTDQAVWSTSNATNATVSNARGNAGLVTGVAKGKLTVKATFGGVSDSAKLTVAAVPLRSIEVSPQTASLPEGTKQQLIATGIFGNTAKGGTASLLKFDVTSQVTWTSSTAGVRVSNASGSEGLALAVDPGTAVITATDPDSTVTGTAWITVTPAVLTALSIANAAGQLPLGSSLQYRATGTFSDGAKRDLTSAVVWTTTAKSVASIANTLGFAGRAIAKALGHTDIGAFDPSTGINAPSVPLDVVAVTLTSLVIAPGTSNIPDGLTQQFTATGTYNSGLHLDLTTEAIWSVTSGTATVSDASGSQGLASSQGPGTSIIQVVEPVSGLQATATLNVTGVQLISLAVTPAAPSVPAGLTQQFVATGTFSDGTAQDLTAVAVWSSSQPDVFGVSSADGSNGLGYALAPGTSVVSAVDPTTGETGIATVTVTTAALLSIAVSPANATLGGFVPQQFTATGTFTDGSTSDLTPRVTWQSTMPGVLNFSTDATTKGLGTTGNPGVSAISATDPVTGITGQTLVTVAQTGETFPISLTLTTAVECCFGCGEPFDIIVTDMDANGNVIDSISVASADVAAAPGGSITVTLPTQLPAGASYTIDVETDSEVYSCPIAAGSNEVSDVISAPVTYSPNCFRNNC